MGDNFNPRLVDLDTADPREVICYLTASGGNIHGHLNTRIAALFVVLVVSTLTTLFPVVATRVRWLRIPLYGYLFARYFGAGVIIATAFIHLMDPSYASIGPGTCVGMTGRWATFSWPPALALVASMLIFLVDFLAEYYVEMRYGVVHVDTEGIITKDANNAGHHPSQRLASVAEDHQFPPPRRPSVASTAHFQPRRSSVASTALNDRYEIEEAKQLEESPSETASGFQSQIAAFLVLEFGVLLHSIIIGLNFGSSSDAIKTLFPVIIFHQSFEGLGIGARLSVIPFPPQYHWMPWALCLAYGFTTPISIAIGIGLQSSYNGNSYTANAVSGILSGISAGILLYAGFVEMLARDFMFNPNRTNDKARLAFMITSLYFGAGIMTLLGKWA